MAVIEPFDATYDWRSAQARLAGLVGSALAAGSAGAVDLPQDRADVLYHYYDGGGTKASGPAVLVRKGFADRFSLSGSYYVDAVSNASIDVITTASPYRERRTETGVGLDYVYRDALMTVSATRSHEPDYTANAVNLDVSQEVFGGMTTVAMGFTRANDKVGRKDVGFFDTARHWRYRLGATQVLTPKWLMSVNGEAMSDDGYLGSPYRAARVFGALIPERNPRTRSGRAVELRAAGDMGEFLSRSAVRASYRYYWDNWSIRAHTLEFGGSRYIGDQWLLDAFVRFHAQHHALFYSDNATEETLYVSRNRQLGSFRDIGVGVKAAYTAWKVPGQYDVKVNGSIERVAFRYSDFTDLRDGSLYRFNANLVQLFVSATF